METLLTRVSGKGLRLGVFAIAACLLAVCVRQSAGDFLSEKNTMYSGIIQKCIEGINNVPCNVEADKNIVLNMVVNSFGQEDLLQTFILRLQENCNATMEQLRNTINYVVKAVPDYIEAIKTKAAEQFQNGNHNSQSMETFMDQSNAVYSSIYDNVSNAMQNDPNGNAEGKKILLELLSSSFNGNGVMNDFIGELNKNYLEKLHQLNCTLNYVNAAIKHCLEDVVANAEAQFMYRKWEPQIEVLTEDYLFSYENDIVNEALKRDPTATVTAEPFIQSATRYCVNNMFNARDVVRCLIHKYLLYVRELRGDVRNCVKNVMQDYIGSIVKEATSRDLGLSFSGFTVQDN